MARQPSKAEQVEQALLLQLDRLEKRIARLTQEKQVLKATIAAHRISKLDYRGSIRKNSFSRLIVQKRVMDLMKSEKRDVSVVRLYDAVNKGHENQPMNHTTFRSHIYRMKEEGKIEQSDRRGFYKLKK